MDVPDSGFTAAMRSALTTALAQAARVTNSQIVVGTPVQTTEAAGASNSEAPPAGAGRRSRARSALEAKRRDTDVMTMIRCAPRRSSVRALICHVATLLSSFRGGATGARCPPAAIRFILPLLSRSRSVPITIRGINAQSASNIIVAIQAATASTGVARSALSSAGRVGSVLRVAPPVATVTIGVSLYLTSRNAGPQEVGSAISGMLQGGSQVLNTALDENSLSGVTVRAGQGGDAMGAAVAQPPLPPLPPLPPIAPSGCAAAPCAAGVECLQLSPADATRLGTDFTCGDCPAGFSGDGLTCEDINECSQSPSPCDARTTCSNTLGSFRCGPCPFGFRGTGETGCVIESACATNNGGCDPRVSCTDVRGPDNVLRSVCGPCPVGTNGTGNTQCKDIDGCVVVRIRARSPQDPFPSRPNVYCDPS